MTTTDTAPAISTDQPDHDNIPRLRWGHPDTFGTVHTVRNGAIALTIVDPTTPIPGWVNTAALGSDIYSDPHCFTNTRRDRGTWAPGHGAWMYNPGADPRHEWRLVGIHNNMHARFVAADTPWTPTPAPAHRADTTLNPHLAQFLADSPGLDGLRCGYTTLEDLLDDAAEDEGLDPDAAQDAARTTWNARVAEQNTWTTPSDADRLTAAFTELNADGIVARENWTCCSTCGHDDLWELMKTMPITPGGYVFFHQQDSERLGEDPTDATLYLAYGPGPIVTNADEADAVALIAAARVVDVLREHAFAVTWDGDINRRIAVDISDWRKRLPGT